MTAVVATLWGCGPDLRENGAPGRAESVQLEAVETIQFEESGEAIITNLSPSTWGLAFSAEGKMAVADLAGSRVLLFDRAGSLLGQTGRSGQGPGEFGTIWSVAWDSGNRIWASDEQRITVLGEDLSLDTIFQGAPGMEYARQMGPVGDEMVISESRYPVVGPAIRLYSLSGEPGPVIFEVPDRDGEPYVQSQFHSPFHVAGDTILVASSVSYPLYAYERSGGLISTFGSRPPSIGTMTYPGRGAFSGDRNPLAWDWLRTFGVVRSIWALHDSLVVVEHMRPHPDRGGIPPTHFWIDVYDRWSLEKIAEDVPIPGHVVAVHDDLLWIVTETPLTSDPLGGPWGITGFSAVPSR